MAAVKFDKPPQLVTREEAREAFPDEVTAGDEALTGKTMRARRTAYITALYERGLYDGRFAGWRHTSNRYLDRGGNTVMGKATPTTSGRAGGRGTARTSLSG